MHPPTRKELEASLEAYFRKSVKEKLGGHVVKLAPTEKGVPDRLVMLPGGRLVLVELKADGGRLSPAQEYWHERAKDLGTEVVVLEGRGQIHQWCVGLLEETTDVDRRPARSPEYDLGYRSGYQNAVNRFKRGEAA